MPAYDYSRGGYYFVTVCTKRRIEYFGKIVGEIMLSTRIGEIAHLRWQEIPEHYNNVILDQFVIMPNHIHGIIIIENEDNVGTEHCSVPTIRYNESKAGIRKRYGLLSRIIKSYKGAVTKDVRRLLGNWEFAWQRSFYDHIIRNDVALNEIRNYIIQNPAKWDIDENNPANIEDWGIKSVKET